MGKRSPDAARINARVGEQVNATMKAQSLTGEALATQVAAIRARRGAPGTIRHRAVWASRRIRGAINLVYPRRVVVDYTPTDDLADIAEALGTTPGALITAAGLTPASPNPTPVQEDRHASRHP